MSAKTSSTCTNTAEGLLLGFGAPACMGFDQTALTATGTITITTNAGPSTVFTKGILRIQMVNPNAGTTLAIGTVTVTDGVTTVQMGTGTALATTSAGVEVEVIKDIISALNATTITFTVTLAGSPTTVTVNSEFYGNP